MSSVSTDHGSLPPGMAAHLSGPPRWVVDRTDAERAGGRAAAVMVVGSTTVAGWSLASAPNGWVLLLAPAIFVPLGCWVWFTRLGQVVAAGDGWYVTSAGIPRWTRVLQFRDVTRVRVHPVGRLSFVVRIRAGHRRLQLNLMPSHDPRENDLSRHLAAELLNARNLDPATAVYLHAVAGATGPLFRTVADAEALALRYGRRQRPGWWREVSLAHGVTVSLLAPFALVFALYAVLDHRWDQPFSVDPTSLLFLPFCLGILLVLRSVTRTYRRHQRLDAQLRAAGEFPLSARR